MSNFRFGAKLRFVAFLEWISYNEIEIDFFNFSSIFKFNSQNWNDFLFQFNLHNGM